MIRSMNNTNTAKLTKTETALIRRMEKFGRVSVMVIFRGAKRIGAREYDAATSLVEKGLARKVWHESINQTHAGRTVRGCEKVIELV